MTHYNISRSHVMPHVGEEFCSCVIGAGGGVHFSFDDAAVVLGTQHQHWRLYQLWLWQVEKNGSPDVGVGLGKRVVWAGGW